MEKLFILFMLLLFAVVITNGTIFDEGGIQSDAIEMKSNTQSVLQEANTQMVNFEGNK
ncbi:MULTISPECIES: hypothetical protein [Bacillaceae]|uniref:Uncharacterized protein n=1 Tax=Cytobacillus gottheilii TaxID=859144 RepID=A0ABX8FIT3_9BACI|nr:MULTISPECIES: hypothetical protein [Bacillaceae]QVY63939.1 hypothetical protein J1899_22460 [Cytobacillus gottheilii]